MSLLDNDFVVDNGRPMWRPGQPYVVGLARVTRDMIGGLVVEAITDAKIRRQRARTPANTCG